MHETTLGEQGHKSFAFEIRITHEKFNSLEWKNEKAVDFYNFSDS